MPMAASAPGVEISSIHVAGLRSSRMGTTPSTACVRSCSSLFHSEVVFFWLQRECVHFVAQRKNNWSCYFDFDRHGSGPKARGVNQECLNHVSPFSLYSGKSLPTKRLAAMLAESALTFGTALLDIWPLSRYICSVPRKRQRGRAPAAPKVHCR